MDLASPSSLVIRPGLGSVVRVLAGTGAPLTGRTIARLAGVSPAGAAKVLATLSRHGVVDSQSAGSANLYRLNREHLLVGPMLALLSTAQRLEANINDELRGWLVPCDGAILFGSAARRDGGLDSDLDILLIRPKGVAMANTVWREQLDSTADKVKAWTGNICSWMDYSTPEFVNLMASSDPFVGEVRTDGRWLIEPPPGLRDIAALQQPSNGSPRW